MPPISGSQKALMQARAGIGRFGATRFGYFRQNCVLVVNGVDRSLKYEALQVSLGISEQPSTASFTVLPTAGFVPNPDEIVTISFGHYTNREFGGQVLRVRHRRMRGNVGAWIDVECTDFMRLMDRYLVVAGYVNTPADEIIIDIIQRFTVGFTFAGVQRGLPVISEFSAVNERPSQCLRRIREMIGRGGYYVDPYKDVHFFTTVGEEGYGARTRPLPISNNILTLDQFAHELDGSQERTKATGEGKGTTCPIGTPDGVSSVTVTASQICDYLVVAGGGGGGTGQGGGGGAGGVKTGTATLTAGTYNVVVGAGGAAANDGNDSSIIHSVDPVILSIVATKGGKGGNAPNGSGNPGGSGGGGEGAGAGGAGSAGEGFAGGRGQTFLGGSAGGGGGATGPGQSGFLDHTSDATGGQGGPGLASSISGVNQYYAGGGGGGGAIQGGIGGIGGGGASGVAGTANTGGGGGRNAAGGSGIVIIRYPVGSLNATGGTITTVGGYTIHTFTGNGSFVISDLTYVAPPPVVTDLPLDEPTEIDETGGTVRIGTTVVAYTSVDVPISKGQNPLGSTLTSAATAGATSLSVADSAQFANAPGWVKVGEQIVRYTSKAAGTLGGISATGFGALNAAVANGEAVTRLGVIYLTTGTVFHPALKASVEVVQRVSVSDLTAAAVMAAKDGTADGVREGFFSNSDLGVAGLSSRGAADTATFGSPLLVANWTTRDMNARPGALQVVAKEAPDSVTASIIINSVTFSFKRGINMPPERVCSGSPVRLPQIIDVAITDKR